MLQLLIAEAPLMVESCSSQVEAALASDSADCEVRGVDVDRVRRGRASLLDEVVYERLAEIFRVLADPTRARIVYCLLQQDLCTCEIAAIARLSEPLVSQHLRLLRTLHLVRTRRAGRMVYYSLDDEHVAQLLEVSLRHLGHGHDAPPTPSATSQPDRYEEEPTDEGR
jgi:ArsR family transcriptional regulator, lead/cadmium/zinc/bismuth-responsive transcriptional repressor